MKTALQLALVAIVGLVLSACGPQQHFTQAQIESMNGHGMDWVKDRIGGPYVVTDAGESVWWDYNNIIMPDGRKDGTCSLVFVKGMVTKVKCE